MTNIVFYKMCYTLYCQVLARPTNIVSQESEILSSKKSLPVFPRRKACFCFLKAKNDFEVFRNISKQILTVEQYYLHVQTFLATQSQMFVNKNKQNLFHNVFERFETISLTHAKYDCGAMFCYLAKRSNISCKPNFRPWPNYQTLFEKHLKFSNVFLFGHILKIA